MQIAALFLAYLICFMILYLVVPDGTLDFLATVGTQVLDLFNALDRQ